MSKNVRYAIEAILFAALILIIAVMVPIVQGYFLTKNHVPDIIDSYASVDFLQQEVSFGTISTIEPIWLMPTIAFVALASLYYFCRKRLQGKRATRGNIQ